MAPTLVVTDEKVIAVSLDEPKMQCQSVPSWSTSSSQRPNRLTLGRQAKWRQTLAYLRIYCARDDCPRHGRLPQMERPDRALTQR